MSHEPPVPGASQSPYPIAEPPHPDIELPPLAAANDSGPAGLRERAHELADDVRNLDVDGRTLVGIGAAIALGAAATVAAVFFSRRSPPSPARKQAAPKRRARKAPSSKKAA